ncbi:hypothetical protein RND81_03G020400 [Saponaria officinalis]|uniref:Uncharacterized protein n=1 Tax=Saponaria officinalis TaxID=3572 RepID=A0AAW1LY83_SAPOF
MASGFPRSWVWLISDKKRMLTSLQKKRRLERKRIRRLVKLIRLDICVQMTFCDEAAPVWLKLRIPADLMAHIQFSQKNTNLRYICHHHGASKNPSHYPAFTMKPKENVPFPSDFVVGMSSAVIGSKVYCFGGDWKIACMQGIIKESDTVVDEMSIFRRPRYLDFASKIKTTKWEIGQPLCSPRYSPQILVVEDKLYVFGGNVPSDCFAEVLDPLKGYWEALPDFPFGPIPSDRLIVAFGPSPQILLFNKKDEKAYMYHPSTRSWDSYNMEFEDQLSRMHGQPITVEDTLFWLDKDGDIYAFDWNARKLFYGPVAGLWHELKCRDGWRMSVLSLFHLVNELFCLVWDDQSRDDVHLTIIRVQKEPVETRLFVVVVACMRYKLSNMSNLEGAHLL